jgi:mRNA interferase RelE/StbE
MTFIIELSDEASQELDGIERKDAQRIINKLQEAAENPFRYFMRLSGRPEFKLRVGEYRLIAHISTNESRILIMTLGHRRNVYK